MEAALGTLVPFIVMDVDVAPTEPFANNILAFADDEFDLLHEDITTMPATVKRKKITFFVDLILVMI